MNTEISSQEKITYKIILHEKEFMKNLIAKLISRFGDSIDTIAYSWMVYQLTGSKVLIASLFAVNALPHLIFGMISGVVSGYYSKKVIVFLCDIGRGIVVLLTAVLFMMKLLKPWHLYIFTFLNSTFESFRTPAAIALNSYILDKNKFDHGVSLDTTLTTIAELIGLSIAAALIAVLGIGGVIMVDSATFFICGLIVMTIKYNNDVIKKESLTVKGYFKDLKEGFKYLVDYKFILNMCILGAIINLLVVPFDSMQAPYVSEVLHKGPEALSFMFIPFLLAMILGGMLVPKVKNKISPKSMFIGSGVLLGLSYLGYSQMDKMLGCTSFEYLPLICVSFLMGISVTFLNIPIQIVFLTKIDKEFIPRVSSIFNALILCATPLGGVITGALCKFLTLQQLFLYFSIGEIILFLSQIFNKYLNEM